MDDEDSFYFMDTEEVSLDDLYEEEEEEEEMDDEEERTRVNAIENNLDARMAGVKAEDMGNMDEIKTEPSPKRRDLVGSVTRRITRAMSRRAKERTIDGNTWDSGEKTKRTKSASKEHRKKTLALDLQDVYSDGYEVKVWANDRLEAELAREVHQCATIFGLSPWVVRGLLWHAAWKKERLMERYMEEPLRTLQNAGILPTTATDVPESIPPPHVVETKSGPFTCCICYDVAEDGEHMDVATLTVCGHAFCTACWETYVSMRVKDGDAVPGVLCCPGEGCKMPLQEETVIAFSKPNILQRYRELLLQSHVDSMPYLKWCPAPNCKYAIECHHTSADALMHQVPIVTCACTHSFCFGCPEPEHTPIPCALLRLWRKKCTDDSETSHWIKSNTKECPKCSTSIEKNGGCNHITCRKCQYHFCWVCMGSWANHTGNAYSCNRFKDSGDEVSESRQSLERYLHYYNRYINHADSLKFEADLVAKTEKRMEELQHTTSLSWIEVQFLRQAADTLVSCRRVLQYTYAFAFYLDQTKNATLVFEDNQRDLEMAVEALAEWMERPIPKLVGAITNSFGRQSPHLTFTKHEEVRKAIQEMKQQILDRSTYVRSRREVVLKDVAAGLREERWSYRINVWGDSSAMPGI